MKTRNGLLRMLAILIAATVILAAYGVMAANGYDTENATVFTFSDDGISVTEGKYTDYTVKGTALSIKGSGTYIVSGTCADGSITVKKGTTGVVLILKGLDLTSANTAPIACNKSTEVTIVAYEGTVNTLTDSALNNDETYPDNSDAENAVIKCKDGSKVTICGTGTLNVIANGKNGIKGGATTEEEGESSLTVKELTLNITANVNDGLKSDQELDILSGNITVKAADDGIKSDLVLNIGAEGTEGPVINVVESNEGIEAAVLNIYSGNITVHANDDGINAANSDLTGYSFECNIYGGSLYVDAANGDGIDSNGTLTIAGGTVEVYSSSQNDNSPLDSDGTFTLSGGTVLAVGSGGMAQTPNTVKQSYVTFGSSGMGMGGFGGRGQQSASGVSLKAGSEIEIVNASGETLFKGKALRTASYVFFSSDKISENDTVTLKADGTAAATATAGNAAATGMGGMPGFGGMQGPNGQGNNGRGDQGGNGQFPQGGTQTPDNGTQSGDVPTLPDGSSGFGNMPGFGQNGQQGFGGMTPPDGQQGFGNMPGFGQNGDQQFPQGGMTPPDGAQIPENGGTFTPPEQGTEQPSEGQTDNGASGGWKGNPQGKGSVGDRVNNLVEKPDEGESWLKRHALVVGIGGGAAVGAAVAAAAAAVIVRHKKHKKDNAITSDDLPKID